MIRDNHSLNIFANAALAKTQNKNKHNICWHKEFKLSWTTHDNIKYSYEFL